MSEKNKLAKPRSTFLNKILIAKSTKSGRMVDKKEKRVQSKLRKEVEEGYLDRLLLME